VKDITEKTKLLNSAGKCVNISSITESEETVYKVTPKKDAEYIVSENHIMSLKYTNVEGIFWTEGRQYYRARYLQNLSSHDKVFGLSAEERKLKGSDYESAKSKAYEKALQFLVDKAQETGYNRIGDVLKVSVKDYLALPANTRRILYLYREPINFSGQDVDLEPYMLGLWLGDGTTDAPKITNIDKEIIDYIYEYTETYNLKVTMNKMVYRFASTTGKWGNTFRNLLQQYKLFGNKHIPDEYLFNSRSVRLHVLAGLIDTDGSFDIAKNTYEISQKSDVLSRDIIFLTRSLGLRMTHYKRNKTCVKPDGSRVTGIYNIMTISGEDLDKIPVLLPRKKGRKATKGTDFLVAQFTVTKLDEKQKCFKLETDNVANLLNCDFVVV
jgi:hypothetical protein